MPFDIELLHHFPKDPGVYLMKDAKGVILYIGKAKSLKIRIKQYFALNRDGRAMVPFLTSQVASIETIIAPSEKEALLLENHLIKKHQPKYNALLKDDKTYVSILMTIKHQYPMLKLARYKGRPPSDGLYFGPYINTEAARHTLDTLLKIFPLRQCSDQELASRQRPCILYSMKRCMAPCTQKCSEKDYESLVHHVIQFLKGQDRTLLDQLNNEMQTASNQLEFEKAGSLLKTLKQLEYIISNNKSLVLRDEEDFDVFGLYRLDDDVVIVKLTYREGRLSAAEPFIFLKMPSDNESLLETFLLQHYEAVHDRVKNILLPVSLKNESILKELCEEQLGYSPVFSEPKKGEKKELVILAEKNAKSIFDQEIQKHLEKESLLLDLEETLKLSHFPSKIVCFDISNISGSDVVGAAVAYHDGEKKRSHYRTFKIKNEKATDEYSALKEVLQRYFNKAKLLGELPDLIMIDGGKGQLSTAAKALKDLEIASSDLITLAKEDAKHDKSLRQDIIFSQHFPLGLSLARHSSLLFFLQNIRDEAHRFAVSFHRKRRQKRLIKSALDTLDGIGPVKKTRLLRHFGSVEKIKEASAEDLKSVKGITAKDIQILSDFKHQAE